MLTRSYEECDTLFYQGMNSSQTQVLKYEGVAIMKSTQNLFSESKSQTDSTPKVDCGFFEKVDAPTAEILKHNACKNDFALNEALKHAYNRYESYEQYVHTVNTLNAYLEGDVDKFKSNMVKIGNSHDFKIIVNFSGVPFNVFARGYKESFDGREEKTLLEIMSGYKPNPEREKCLKILVAEFSPKPKKKI
jgi:hypothetical protein